MHKCRHWRDTVPSSEFGAASSVIAFEFDISITIIRLLYYKYYYISDFVFKIPNSFAMPLVHNSNSIHRQGISSFSGLSTSSLCGPLPPPSLLNLRTPICFHFNAVFSCSISAKITICSLREKLLAVTFFRYFLRNRRTKMQKIWHFGLFNRKIQIHRA